MALSLWLCTAGTVANGQWSLDFQTGSVFYGYNDVRIPNQSGTLFSLTEELTPESVVPVRLQVRYQIDSKHAVNLLIAPLSFESAGSLPRAIRFQGSEFPANTALTATYKFNSYRVGYQYTLFRKSAVTAGIGFTAKIRDALIRVTSAAATAEKPNVGFVPLINFKFCWSPVERASLLLDGEALGASQGRAEDVLLALQYRLCPKIAVTAGYRILEGGADVDQVYNFALFHYAVVGLHYEFK